MLPDNWKTLTPDQKLEWRLARWMSGEGKTFATPQARQAYTERASRYAAVVRLQKPDRVPRLLSIADFAAHYAGVTPADMFYDYDKAVPALIRFHRDFDLDYAAGGSFRPGKVYDRLGYTLYKLPGGALERTQSFQYVEAEYMTADEYDALIDNPEGYLLRTYIPRVMTALGGWQNMAPLLSSTELPFVPPMALAFTQESMKQALEAITQAGEETLKFLDASAKVSAVSVGEMGLPPTGGGLTKAPFDYLGDTLRGTRAVAMDMFRRPKQVLAACERLVPLAIETGVFSSNNSGNPFIGLPLHKGADGFMSGRDFEKFYWPTLKATILGLVKEGVVPYLFVEGGYNTRLDVIANSGLPAGRTIWGFDRSDMAQVKQKIGSWACIGGNIPVSLFKAGTPAEMEERVKQVIDTCAPGGGFYLAPGAGIDQAQPENIHTYLKVAKEYGKY